MQHTHKFYFSQLLLRLTVMLSSILAFSVHASITAVSITAASITMQNAVKIAIQHDPWLAGNQLQERALRAASQGANNLPDPMLSMGLLNLPTNGFVFDQEPMTQIKVGLAQTFPRGDSLAIKQKQLSYQADRHPYQMSPERIKLCT
jgi:hypothetical protein